MLTILYRGYPQNKYYIYCLWNVCNFTPLVQVALLLLHYKLFYYRFEQAIHWVCILCFFAHTQYNPAVLLHAIQNSAIVFVFSDSILSKIVVFKCCFNVSEIGVPAVSFTIQTSKKHVHTILYKSNKLPPWNIFYATSLYRFCFVAPTMISPQSLLLLSFSQFSFTGNHKPQLYGNIKPA